MAPASKVLVRIQSVGRMKWILVSLCLFFGCKGREEARIEAAEWANEMGIVPSGIYCHGWEVQCIVREKSDTGPEKWHVLECSTRGRCWHYRTELKP